MPGPVANSSSQSSPPCSARATRVVENILKDFLNYLCSVKERFIPDDGYDYDDNWDPRHGTIDWTKKEAEKHHDHLQFFSRALRDQMHRLPRESKIVRNMLDTMKEAIREGMEEQVGGEYGTRHIIILIENVSKLLHVIQPVDLDKLIQMMKTNQRAGNAMEGKDVVLLCGATGAGKTTTLLHLAGTSFREEEVDGFFHLQPTGYSDPDVARFKTSCGRDAMTKVIQTSQINIDGQEIVICDTPGFGASQSVEEDIANGLGIIRAIHRANTVRPVLVLSREGMGDRFTAFSGTLSSVTRLIGRSENVDLKPFNYIFTKYEPKHRTCMCRQFILIRKRPRVEEEGKVLFRAFVDDIIQKTTPEAKIALPMEGQPHELLRGLLDDEFMVSEPRKYFVPFVSESALRKLKLQLQITLRDILSALVEEDFSLAVFRTQQLSSLALVLPEARECAQLALEATVRHITTERDHICQIVDKVQTVKIHKQFTQLLETFKTEISRIMASEEIRHVCAMYEKESNTSRRRVPGTNESFCIEQVNKLLKIVSRDIPDFEPEYLNTEALMRRRGSFLTGVVRLKEMNELLQNIPGDHFVASMYLKAFEQFHFFVGRVLSEAEQNFQNTPRDMNSFERQAWFLAVLIQGFLNKPDTGSGEHAKMEELENRRLKLMLRLEIKISDTMELITNTRFPDCIQSLKNEPTSLPLVKLSGLQGPRHLLLSVAQLPRLCKFLPSRIDAQEAERSVTVMDQKVIHFMNHVVQEAEMIFDKLEGMRSHDDIPPSKEIVTSFRNDLNQVIEEFAGVRRWSTDIQEQTAGNWSRLLQVKESLHTMIDSIDDKIEIQENLGFSCGTLPISYFCTTPNE